MKKTHCCAPLLLLFLAGPLLAQGQPQPAPEDRRVITEEEKNELLGKAQALRDQAAAIRSKADAANATAQKECWKKFLVSGCQDDARKAQREEVEKARKLEHEAREIERDVRVREVATREAKRVADAPRREAEAAARAEKNREAQEEALRRIERRQAEQAERLQQKQ